MPPESDPPSEAALADALEEYHRKAALGDGVARQTFADRLGPLFPEFEAVLDAEQALDAAMVEPAEREEGLPRPFGPYTLMRELGRGGVGVVYEAVDRRLGRSVALKVLKVSFEDDPVALERFRREAAACARVRHDHIVAIFEAGEVEGQPYYAMDIVPGEPLEAAIRAGRAPKPRDLCRELASVADALQLLHDAGIVHRDVKPPNLMVRPDGRLVLTDFGLARTPGSMKLTRTGAAVGTPLYMSPEQILGTQDGIDARTDVYGLGTVLYEALTGRPPFDTHEMARLIYMIATQRPEPLRAVAPAVPEACERITLKALEKEPSDRYASASAMAADLRAFAEDRTVVGHPLTRRVRAARWARRRWVPLVAAVALVLVGLWAWSRRSATYILETGVPADMTAWIDDEERGRPPRLEVAVAPGTRRVRFERRFFVPSEPRLIEFAPGETKSYPFEVLVPLPEEQIPVEQRQAVITLFNDGLARVVPAWRRLHLPEPMPRALSAMRNSPGTAIPPLVVLPRGRVRPEDLTSWWLEVDPEHEALGGRLELRSGNEVLWTTDIAPEHLERSGERAWACGSLPDDLRTRVRPGDDLLVVWLPPPGHEAVKPEATPLKVVDVDPAIERLIGELDALLPSSPWRTHVRVETLRGAGLFTPALRDASALASTRASDSRAWGSILRIVRDDLGLSHALLVRAIEDWDHRRDGPPPALCSARR